MSEAGWIQIITLVLAALSPIITIWVKGKIKEDMGEQDTLVRQKVEEVKTQNRDIHQDINTKIPKVVKTAVAEELDNRK